MALITQQPPSYTSLSIVPKRSQWNPTSSSSVAFVKLINRKYTHFVPLSLSSTRKTLHIFAFKGNNAHNEDQNTDNCSKFNNKGPVRFSRTQEGTEETVSDSHDKQSPYASTVNGEEDTIAGSRAIHRLFRKWLLILTTQTSSVPNEPLGGTLVTGDTSQGQIVTPKAQTVPLFKSVVIYFLRLDPAISLPLLIFIPFYLCVRVAYGAEVTRELTPMWILGPLIIALYVKIVQGLCALYAACFAYTLSLLKKVPAIYRYVAEGELKATIKGFLWAHVGKPIEDVKNLDYKVFFMKKMKQLQEWVVEKYLDYIESVWPYYCRTIRFLKKANLL